MINTQVIKQQMPYVLKDTNFESLLGHRIEGKARDNYVIGKRRLMIATDRVSAFDQHLGYIPFKGQVVNQLSAFWFNQTKEIVANHMLDVPDPNVMVVKECTLLPVEIVVRAYLTGVTPTSIWYQYERGNRVFCGYQLPDGLKKNHRLPEPIITPSTKAPKGARDESISKGEVLNRSLVDPRQLEHIYEISLALFKKGSDVVSRGGLILVDTKYEFGIDSDGEINLIDEAHTPDSSRFWYASTYEQLYAEGKEQPEYDKEHIRLWLASQGFDGSGPVPQIPTDIFVEASLRYIKVFEDITGQPFKQNEGDAKPRIEESLKSILSKSI
jgi:phosphoribosylaminoimidazole-succinocarboxamide synthase